MYGEQLISELAYGIHPITSNQPPQNLVFRVFEPTPPRPERHEAGAYRGTLKYWKGCRTKKNLFLDMQ